MNQTALPRFNPWPWLPVVVLSVTLVPCIGIAVVAHRLHPTMVEALPYDSSMHMDADKQGRSDFSAAGLRLSATPAGPLLVRLSIARSVAGPPLGAAVVKLYRPDDANRDATIPWADADQALETAVSRPGLWRVRVELTGPGHPGNHPLIDETSVEAPPSETP